jgi:hypothetical protein
MLTFLDTAWERIPLSLATKQAVWRIENGMYSLYDPNLTCLRKRLPEQLPEHGRPAWKVIEACKTLFLDLDLFFVKVCTAPWRPFRDLIDARFLSSCSSYLTFPIYVISR